LGFRTFRTFDEESVPLHDRSVGHGLEINLLLAAQTSPDGLERRESLQGRLVH
jgi:hypothetical protein